MTVANPQALTSWSEKAMAAVRASPGKSTLLTGLVLIMAIAWIRVLVGGHTSPASARAASTAAAPAAMVFTPEPADSHQPAQQGGPSLVQWARQPVRPLTRNPFAVPLEYYPTDASKNDDPGSAGIGYWNLVSKSMSSRADQQEQRQILIDNIRIAAEALKLDSTIMGATPGAMVNGQMVREGGVVNGFRVLKIEARQLIVEREGVKLAIMMN
jgi:hypothetical protein